MDGIDGALSRYIAAALAGACDVCLWKTSCTCVCCRDDTPTMVLHRCPHCLRAESDKHEIASIASFHGTRDGRWFDASLQWKEVPPK